MIINVFDYNLTILSYFFISCCVRTGRRKEWGETSDKHGTKKNQAKSRVIEI